MSLAASLGGPEKSVERPWLLHWPKGTPTHVNYPSASISQLLDEMAVTRPKGVQFVFYGRKLSFAETALQSKRVACGLAKMGIRKGDRVALMMPNCPQFAFVYFGINRLGAVVVPVNPLYTAREVKTVLADSGAQVIFTLDMFYSAVRDGAEGTAVRKIVVSRISDYMPPAISLLGRLLRKVPSGKVTPSEKNVSLKEVMRGDGGNAEVKVNPSEDPAVLMYLAGPPENPRPRY